MEHPIAIDPYGCGCTECLVGEYVPIEDADLEAVIGVLTGEKADHTEGRWSISRHHGYVHISTSESGRTWEVPEEELPEEIVTLREDGRAQYDSAYELSLVRKR